MRSRLPLLVPLCFLAGALSARPDAGERERPSIFSAARRVPDSAELLVVIDSAASLRGTPVGQAVRGALAAGLSPEMRDAWSALSTRLGWTPEETFDNLLGMRAMVIARGLGTPEPSWAILSEVRPDVERRLRERLEVSPRNIVDGRPTLSIERGRYELATERKGKRATIVLGPTATRAEFEEMLPLLAGGPASPLSADRRFARLTTLGEGQALVWIRKAGERPVWTGLVASAAGERINAGLISGADDLAGCDSGVRPWPRAAFDRLAEGSLLAVLERPVAPRGRDTALGDLIGKFPLLALGPEHTALVGDRFTCLALPTPAGLSVAAGLEVRSASSAAPLVDAMIRLGLAGAGLKGIDFDGLCPSAMRTLAVRDLPLPDGVRSMLSPGSEVVWSYPPAASPSPLAGKRASSVESIPEDRGWLIAGLGREAHERIRQSLAGVQGAQCPALSSGRALSGEEAAVADSVRPWVSLGSVRPAKLVASLRDMGVPTRGMLDALGALESVQWSFSLGAENAMGGDIVATLAPRNVPAPPSAPAAPAHR